MKSLTEPIPIEQSGDNEKIMNLTDNPSDLQRWCNLNNSCQNAKSKSKLYATTLYFIRFNIWDKSIMAGAMMIQRASNMPGIEKLDPVQYLAK